MIKNNISKHLLGSAVSIFKIRKIFYYKRYYLLIYLNLKRRIRAIKLQILSYMKEIKGKIEYKIKDFEI